MSHNDVKYTPLLSNVDVSSCSKCCSTRRLFAVLTIVALTLVSLLFTCYSRSNVCSSPVSYKHTKRRLPQCIVIGARKAGTRALLTYLRLHPDIQTAQYEVHFFDNQENYDFGYEWYKKQMPYSFLDQLTIEKTPAYFNNLTVPVKIKAMNSSIKLLLIVRDPVQRCISDQVQLNYKARDLGVDVKPFKELVLRKDGKINERFSPVKRSFYDYYMKQWLKYFPLNQFYIVNGDNMIVDPYSEIYQIETFLGLKHAIPKSAFFYNETKGFYCVKTSTKKKCLSSSKGRPHPDIDDQIIIKLKTLFRPHNENFYKMVNKSFGWDKL